MMKNVIAEGTGRRLYANYDVPYTVMGKTGTTQNQSDGWFIGFSENLVIGAWVGTHDRRIHFRNLGTGSGGRTALPLVAALFEYAAATKTYPNIPFVEETIYECPSYLNEEEYQYLQDYLKRQEQIDEDVYTDVQEDIEEEKKDTKKAAELAKRKKYDPKVKSKESERIQKQREERLKQIEKEKRKWNKKLERLKKKAERRRKRKQ
jgi:penicillin-binding protein 1A